MEPLYRSALSKLKFCTTKMWYLLEIETVIKCIHREKIVNGPKIPKSNTVELECF